MTQYLKSMFYLLLYLLYPSLTRRFVKRMFDTIYINTFCRSWAAISSICQVDEKDDARIRSGTGGEKKNEYSASSITVTTVLSIEDYRFASRDGAAPNGGKEETAVISTKRLSFGRDVKEGQRRSKRTVKNALSKT